MKKVLAALIGSLVMTGTATAQQADLPENALALQGDLPWVVGPAAVPDAARDLFEFPAVRWDRREQELADGTTVLEEIIIRDGPFVTARVTRSDDPAGVVYYNLWGPMLLNTFFRGPSRVRGAMTTDLVVAPREANAAPFSRRWRFNLATFAVSEGMPADIRSRRQTVEGNSRKTGESTVEVEVNGKLLRLPAYRIQTTLRDAATGDLIRTYDEAYIPALAALTLTEALGNSRDITNLEADPVTHIRFQVTPASLPDVVDAAL